MTHLLQGVPETLLIPLWARATETQRDDAIIRDSKAVEMVAQIDYDFDKFAKAWKSQVGVAIRTELFNEGVQQFIQACPEAVIINLGCGLDTRFLQVDNGKIHWYDLDLPETMELRQRFFEETDRYKMMACSVLEPKWAQQIPVQGRPVLLIAEGLCMYFTKQEMEELFATIAQAFSGAEMLLEVMGPAIVKLSDKHDAIGSMDAVFKWGLAESRELESYHNSIRVLAEWNYFDRHKNRWGWLRWMTLLPGFKKRFNNRVVQIAFEKAF